MLDYFYSRIDKLDFPTLLSQSATAMATWNAIEEDWANDDLFAAGGEIAKALITITGGPVRQMHDANITVPDIHLTPIEKEAAAIIGGLIYGITEKEGLADLSECVYDLEELVYDLVHAYGMIRSKTIAGLINGFDLLAATTAKIPEDLAQCAASGSDLVVIGELLKEFRHPRDLVPVIKTNIKKHIGVLGLDVAKAKKFYANEQYFQFGEELGQMLVIVTQPLAADDELDEAAELEEFEFLIKSMPLYL